MLLDALQQYDPSILGFGAFLYAASIRTIGAITGIIGNNMMHQEEQQRTSKHGGRGLWMRRQI